jgi:hypothetical protein
VDLYDVYTAGTVAARQVPRASELFGLEYENGPVSARGIYVYSSHILYLIRYHKVGLRVWGRAVNTQLCRQRTIAITEKHVREVHQRSLGMMTRVRMPI